MAVILALVAAVVSSSTPAPSCERAVPTGPAGLPAPLVVTTACAAFTIFADGRVEAGPPLPSVPGWVPTGAFTTGDGVYWSSDPPYHGHLLVMRDAQVLWRSAGRYRIDEVAAVVGTRSVAFADRRNLYVAPTDGAERRVGAREQPAGWTSAGELLTVRARSIALRARDGALLRRVAGAIGAWRFDESTRTLLYVSAGGRLVRTDGRSSRRLAELRPLGFSFGNTWIQTLSGGLVAVLDGHRVAVVRGDGSLFAHVAFGRRSTVAATSGLVAGAGGVAFTVTRGRRGPEDVYVLRAGDSRATRLLHERLRFAGCGRWADLAWHGHWLLYAATEGPVVVVDAAAPSASLDLSRWVRALPGLEGQPPRLEWQT